MLALDADLCLFASVVELVSVCNTGIEPFLVVWVSSIGAELGSSVEVAASITSPCATSISSDAGIGADFDVEASSADSED